MNVKTIKYSQTQSYMDACLKQLFKSEKTNGRMCAFPNETRGRYARVCVCIYRKLLIVWPWFLLWVKYVKKFWDWGAGDSKSTVMFHLKEIDFNDDIKLTFMLNNNLVSFLLLIAKFSIAVKLNIYYCNYNSF